MVKIAENQIIYFTQTSEFGGCEKHLIQLIQTIGISNAQTTVIISLPKSISQQNKSIIVDNFEKLINSGDVSHIHTIESDSLLEIDAIKQIITFFSKENSIIHFYRNSLDSCLIPILISFFLRKKSIQTLQNRLIIEDTLPSIRSKILYPISLKISKKIIAVSESIKSQCIDLYGIPSEKIAVIRNGIKIDEFTDISKNKRDKIYDISKELKIDLNTQTIFLCLARLDHQKGHTYLIKALSILKNKYPNIINQIIVLLAGEGGLRESIQDEVKTNQLESVVKILGFRSDVDDLLLLCDAMILTSLFEGLPLSIVEAMSFGKPVLATAVDGVPEIIVDSQTGILMESQNPSSIADSIVKFIKLPIENRTSMGVEGKKRVCSEFNLALNSDIIKVIYQTIMN